MQGDPKTSRSLSEIGHLFLSSVRDRQTNGAPMPRRQPPERFSLTVPQPPQLDLKIDVKAAAAPAVGFVPLQGEERLSFPPITAILGAHLNEKQSARARDYAAHLAGRGERIGLIEVGTSGFRVTRFDPSAGEEAALEEALEIDRPLEESADARSLNDALEELSWDLDRWLLVLPNSRSTEARALLREVGHWVLLSTCDHDGVVSCYRTLKGVQDSQQPRLTLAVLDAPSSREADKVHQKLANVCRQFMEWSLEAEAPVASKPDAAAHEILRSALPSAFTVVESSPQWQVLAGFVAKAEAAAMESEPEVPAERLESRPEPIRTETPEASTPMMRSTTVKPVEPAVSQGVAAEPSPMRWAEASEAVSEVIELTEAGSTSASILTAILRSESTNLFECPVTPPMCPDARLAVTRDHRVVLLAAARQGLCELRSIGRAYNWLIENYKLICMAVPQLAIDPGAQPCLRLLIDHADLSAEILQPMLQSSTVTVQAYRRLRWGGKTGLLLEAA